MFKERQTVKVKEGRFNASVINQKEGYHFRGVYELENPHKTVFTIEGTVKLVSFEHNSKIKCAYLLQHKGKSIGYVYDYGLEEYKEPTKEELIEDLVKRVFIYAWGRPTPFAYQSLMERYDKEIKAILAK